MAVIKCDCIDERTKVDLIHALENWIADHESTIEWAEKTKLFEEKTREDAIDSIRTAIDNTKDAIEEIKKIPECEV